MDTIKINKKNTQMVAHAGLLGMETPNTLAGVIAAGNRSYWGIEIDVRTAKDGELVLIHNDSLMDSAGVDIKVSESTLEELQQISLYDRRRFQNMEKYGIEPAADVRRSDLRISTASEYIRLCKKYGKIAVTELKENMTPDGIAYLLEQFREQDYLDKAVFISFMWDNLAEIRRQAPGQTVQFLTGEEMDFTDEFLDKVAENAFDLDVNVLTVTEELVNRIHQRGIKVNVWTVDLPDIADNLVKWGVDYITSDILE